MFEQNIDADAKFLINSYYLIYLVLWICIYYCIDEVVSAIKIFVMVMKKLLLNITTC